MLHLAYINQGLVVQCTEVQPGVYETTRHEKGHQSIVLSRTLDRNTALDVYLLTVDDDVALERLK